MNSRISSRQLNDRRISLDPDTGLILIEGEPLALDRSSAAILLALLRAGGEPVDKARLLEIGWPDRIVHENSLAKAIGRIRAALGDAAPQLEAVYGRGYQLVTTEGDAGAATVPGGAATPARGAWRRLLPEAAAKPKAWAFAAIAVLALMAGAAAWSMWLDHKRAQQGSELVAWLSNDILAQADAYGTGSRDKSLRAAVERTSATMNARFAGQPDTLVALHRIIANAFSSWGEYNKAVFHLDAAAAIEAREHGRDTIEYAQIATSLCQQLRLDGKTGRAKIMCDTAISIKDRLGSPDLARTQVTQAKLYFEIGDYSRASAQLEQVLKSNGSLGPRVEAEANWFEGLALRKLGRFEEAETAFQRNLTLRERELGKAHPLTAWALSDYGDLLIDSGEFDRAESVLERARRIFADTLGADHPEALSPQYSLGVLRLWQGRPGEAKALLEPVLDTYRKDLGSDHFWTLYTLTELALAEAELGHVGRASTLLAEARASGSRSLYGLDAKSAHFHLRWGRVLIELRQSDEARREIEMARVAIDRAFARTPVWQARLHCLSAHLAAQEGARQRQRDEVRSCQSALREAKMPDTVPLWNVI